MTDRHLTDTELGERYGRSRYFVQEQCKAKRWPHLRVGKAYRFTVEHVAAIDRLLEVGIIIADAPAEIPTNPNPWGVKGRSS